MAQASKTFLWSGEVDNLQGYLQIVPRNTKLKCSVTEEHNGHLWSVGAGLQQVIDNYKDLITGQIVTILKPVE